MIAVCVLLAPVLGSIPANASGLATFGLALSSSSVATGEDFTAKVWVNPNGEAIDTIRVHLSFDPAVVEATWFDIGTAFPSLSPAYTIDNDAGSVDVGAFKYGDRVTDSTVAMTVTFKGKAAGSTAITIEDDSRLIDDGVEMIDAAGTTEAGVKTVTVGEGITTTDKSLEETALIYFGAFAGRMPSSSVDWEALHCMAYDTCYPADIADRDVAHEAQSLVVFGAKYAHIPSTPADWRALHAIAYTDIFYDWSAIDAANGS
ncbi:hypothetical protein A2348_02210 [Candidatus Uhrbacteria bacterium RIFOXYB12_FULL_58_10]|uniref:Uncharacterized protein n=1 Tax=Candidatus Uhrbacteria bacterium RIFOXYB2_FULL_57_15 TaxID=1802422 RepID=A0A1F7W734_9BACT|nr:MAG: hypothetical protein A2348_02210 [Candidatus Uhrbacteria bacterium RIFOXYB12_FULL_58_10]OGL98589.1 MAG: hypothetical protein A2304_00675 [Candidatus Uhrbacteria bacterium RIFOXYB2_FULL_57_15]OGL99117.1 MAG: hypothetical protein A2501_00530 [Candidatus Uhrbacteria bacterium RIFOXYC12_FULL_57_11]